MTTWYRVQGDVEDTITAELKGINDLTGAVSVEAHVMQCGVGVADLPTTILDPLNRIVVADLGGWLPTAAPGQWEIEFEVVFGNGSTLTWPSKAFDRVVVRQQGG